VAVTELEPAVAEIRRQGGVARAALGPLQSRYEDLKLNYDEAAPRGARAQQKKLTPRPGARAPQGERLTDGVTPRGLQRQRFEAVGREIHELRDHIRDYKATLGFVRDLRHHVFNRVSDQLSERFREGIGRTADRIYRAIARSDEGLRWGDGYAVELVN